MVTYLREVTQHPSTGMAPLFALTTLGNVRVRPRRPIDARDWDTPQPGDFPGPPGNGSDVREPDRDHS